MKKLLSILSLVTSAILTSLSAQAGTAACFDVTTPSMVGTSVKVDTATGKLTLSFDRIQANDFFSHQPENVTTFSASYKKSSFEEKRVPKSVHSDALVKTGTTITRYAFQIGSTSVKMENTWKLNRKGDLDIHVPTSTPSKELLIGSFEVRSNTRTNAVESRVLILQEIRGALHSAQNLILNVKPGACRD